MDEKVPAEPPPMMVTSRVMVSWGLKALRLKLEVGLANVDGVRHAERMAVGTRRERMIDQNRKVYVARDIVRTLILMGGGL